MLGSYNQNLKVGTPEYEPQSSGLNEVTIYDRYHVEALKPGRSALIFTTMYENRGGETIVHCEVMQ